MTDEQIRQVENIVNSEILANVDCQHRVMPIAEAQTIGATMLFGEKYGDEVRVIDIGSSCELCGGTHVGRTGDIGIFTIVAEGGVAAGVRRVEAITGDVALAYMRGESAGVGRHRRNAQSVAGRCSVARLSRFLTRYANSDARTCVAQEQAGCRARGWPGRQCCACEGRKSAGGNT